jgi:hypothetical protein
MPIFSLIPTCLSGLLDLLCSFGTCFLKNVFTASPLSRTLNREWSPLCAGICLQMVVKMGILFKNHIFLKWAIFGSCSVLPTYFHIHLCLHFMLAGGRP